VQFVPPRSKRRRRRHPRAVAVATAGVLALIATGGFGTPALRPLGIGLIVLGVGAIVAVEVVARGITVSRTIDRDTVPAGERANVTVRVAGWPVRNRAIRLLDWEVRAGLPSVARTEPRRPAFLLGEIRQQIVLSGLPRGEHRFEQPGVSLGDAFGLARVRRASRADTRLLVLPERVPVVVPFWESGAARRAGQHAGLLRGRAELGGVRDYEPGDPLSLIHWAQTARRGRLQTKELHGESGRGATLTLLLDAQTPGEGVGTDAFELAVSAAASLLAVCATRGDNVGMEHTAARPAMLPVGTPAPTIERELALVRPDGTQPASLALRAILGRPATPRTVVIISATGDRGLAGAAGQARAAGVSIAAVMIGPARVYAQDLRRSGAWVTEAGSAGDLAIALDGSGAYAKNA
jgi:uncharacterized protein (DUF58 family)